MVSFGVQVNTSNSGILSRRDSGSHFNNSNGFGNVLTERNNQLPLFSKLNGISGPKQMPL